MVAGRLTLALWACSFTAHALLVHAGPDLQGTGPGVLTEECGTAAAGTKECGKAAGSFDDPEMASVYSTLAAQHTHPRGPWLAILTEVFLELCLVDPCSSSRIPGSERLAETSDLRAD